MIAKTYLLPWTFLCVDLFLIAFGMYQFNILDILREDTSYISFGIFLSYVVIGNIFCFILVKLQKNSNNLGKKEYFSRLSFWMLSSFTLLGLIGTLIGMRTALYSLFAGFDLTNIQKSLDIIRDAAGGIEIALVSSLVGMICYFLFSAKLVVMNNANEV